MKTKKCYRRDGTLNYTDRVLDDEEHKREESQNSLRHCLWAFTIMICMLLFYFAISINRCGC